jgi:hypothetical protein
MEGMRAATRESQVLEEPKLAKTETGLKATANVIQGKFEAGLCVNQETMEIKQERTSPDQENKLKLRTASNTAPDRSESTAKAVPKEMWTTIRAGQGEMWTTIRAGQEEMWTTIRADQEEMWTTIRAGQGEMWTTIRVDQDEMLATVRASEDEMWTTIKAGQEKMLTTIRAGQEKMWKMISAMISPQAEMEETGIKGTQKLCEEPNREMRNLRTSIEAIRRELRTQLAQVETEEWRRGRRTVPMSPRRTGRPVCWRCGVIGHIRLDCPRRCLRRRRQDTRENTADRAQCSRDSSCSCCT